MFALLNITPSYKILITPILATLKEETCSCYTFSVPNTVCVVFDGCLQVINNLCFLIIISCCRFITQFNISFPSTLRASRPLFYSFPKQNFVRIYHFPTNVTTLTLVFSRVLLSSTNIWCMRLKRGLPRASRSKASSFFGIPSQSTFHHCSLHI